MLKKKALFIFLAIVSALAGCTKEQHPAGLEFSAVAESFVPAEGLTKTALNEGVGGFAVSWNEGDRISINNYGYEAVTVSGGTATFMPMERGAVSPVFKAVYPSSAAKWDGSAMLVTLPYEQKEPDLGLVSGFPMYAESSTGSLNFRNLCGLLRLELKAASGSFKVSSIELKSNNLNLSGECSIGSDGSGAWQVVPPAVSGTPAGLKYSCDRLVGNESAAYFYIYLPPGEYEGFDISINTDAGTVHKAAKESVSVEVQRSKVTTVSFLSLDPRYVGHEYVDFGLSVKWATMNVGATSVTDRGANAAWSDAQTVPWGGAWRVPTKAELEELIANTYWQWTTSYRESGIAGYVVFKTYEDADKGQITGSYSPSHIYEPDVDVHIFLPGTSDDHQQGVYWTSSEDAESALKAYRLQYSKSTAPLREVNSGGKTLTLYVRPVCD